MYEKYIKDGKVAVLYKSGYGSGWYTWNSQHKGLLFDKEIVEAVLLEDYDLAKKIAEEKYPGGFYDTDGLSIDWLDEGVVFKVECFDGKERIEIICYDGLMAWDDTKNYHLIHPLYMKKTTGKSVSKKRTKLHPDLTLTDITFYYSIECYFPKIKTWSSDYPKATTFTTQEGAELYLKKLINYYHILSLDKTPKIIYTIDELELLKRRITELESQRV